ncbi:MAG: hypothetical protein JW738_10295 [Actinobacteria bacterium]|nr:hypothetical protein [Actinomycetota bacterium]
MPQSGIKGRTVRDFQAAGDVWGALDSWARQYSYDLVEQDQVSRTYKKGTGLLVAPQVVKISWTGSFYRLEAWVRGIMINRILSFGLIPEESVIESGGFLNVIPRSMAREKVNLLLQMFGQPPIP